jgi:hypothetical protein
MRNKPVRRRRRGTSARLERTERPTRSEPIEAFSALPQNALRLASESNCWRPIRPLASGLLSRLSVQAPLRKSTELACRQARGAYARARQRPVHTTESGVLSLVRDVGYGFATFLQVRFLKDTGSLPRTYSRVFLEDRTLTLWRGHANQVVQALAGTLIPLSSHVCLPGEKEWSGNRPIWA